MKLWWKKKPGHVLFSAVSPLMELYWSGRVHCAGFVDILHYIMMSEALSMLVGSSRIVSELIDICKLSKIVLFLMIAPEVVGEQEQRTKRGGSE